MLFYLKIPAWKILFIYKNIYLQLPNLAMIEAFFESNLHEIPNAFVSYRIELWNLPLIFKQLSY